MSSHQTSLGSKVSTRSLAFALLLPLLLVTTLVRAQDAVRPSLAGEAAAEARRQSLDHIPYNLLLGPVRFRFSATAGVEYNDNVNVAEVNEQEDFIFRPQVNLNALWPITQLNTLRFDIGLGYAFYASHSEYNTNGILLSPGSALSFDIFVSDFRINVHDRFSLEQDPIGEPQLSGVADYGRFQNTAGVSVLWDLNKAVVTLGYDHFNFIATNSDFDYLDRNSDSITGSVSFAATSTTGIGLEGSFTVNAYDRNVLNDSDSYSGGAFVETQITNYLKLRVAGGYQNISFDGRLLTLGPFPDGSFLFFQDRSSLNDFYVNALLSHRINAAITQRLSVGHESQLGINSNYIKLNYVRHTATWNIINRTLLSTEFFYEDAEDSGGFVNEHLQRYGGALSLGYQLTQHVTLGARYQYTQKDSDVPLRDYKQNRVSLDGTYSF
ncbi:MAG: outer membrane beta-barrel protein [Chthoniobacterales bacterium]